MRLTYASQRWVPLAVASLVIACDASGSGAGARHLVYDGTYTRSKETAALASDCAADGETGDAEGVLFLESGPNPTLRADGFGCRIRVTAQGNDAWVGAPGPCVFDGVTGAAAIGITQVVVDESTLDIPGSQFHLRAHLQRHTGAGPVWFCLDIRATVSTTLPPASSAGS
jgi:hypothetical protein